MRILFTLMSSESFQIQDKDRRCLEYLDFLNSLFVFLAPIAVPSILLTQFLVTHKLSKTVIDLDSVILRLLH